MIYITLSLLLLYVMFMRFAHGFACCYNSSFIAVKYNNAAEDNLVHVSLGAWTQSE